MSMLRTLAACLLARVCAPASLLGLLIAAMVLGLSTTYAAQGDSRHYVPPMPAFAASDLVIADFFDASSFGGDDSTGVPVGNRYVQQIAVADNSEVSPYDANGNVVCVITFAEAGEVRAFHLPGSGGTARQAGMH